MSEQFDSSRPIYAQLVERLKARILAGTYQSGGHLDSVRDLAAAAGVNPNTMQRALAQLEAEGLVRTERTSGRFVTEDIDLIEQLRASAARNIAADFLEKMRSIGYTPQQAAELLRSWNETEGKQHE
ncbi:MAG: GntR family transcriptional regulator [Faecalibacterium prausnitzii]|jgi:GntR family transcriptional regulator|uniref:GntR family transcriptional regulator n=1 Tax=Faecalibacterium prausnitzii TaxID=853 RepID=UPI0026654D56|nr:GntR family transcriptional regulator [Faecalibacterium prausnitzii]MEE0285811.1 GntR family transcriptional regulator [Faecalibacterium prausnitzii]